MVPHLVGVIGVGERRRRGGARQRIQPHARLDGQGWLLLIMLLLQITAIMPCIRIVCSSGTHVFLRNPGEVVLVGVQSLPDNIFRQLIDFAFSQGALAKREDTRSVVGWFLTCAFFSTFCVFLGSYVIWHVLYFSWHFPLHASFTLLNTSFARVDR